MEPNCVTFRNNKVRGMLFNNPVGRYTPVNPYAAGYTQQELDMRRKAEILQYNKTSNGRLKKTEAWVNVVAGSTQRRRYSSYYIKGLVDGSNSECPLDIAIPTLSTSSGVPGPPILLYYDARVPLYNYSSRQNAFGTQPDQTTTEYLTLSNSDNNNSSEQSDSTITSNRNFIVQPTDAFSFETTRSTVIDTTNVLKNNNVQNIFTLNIPKNSILEPTETFSFTTSVALYVSGYTSVTDGAIEMSIPLQNLSLSIVFGGSIITLRQPPITSFSAGFVRDLSCAIISAGQFAGKVYMGEVTFSNITLNTSVGMTYDFYVTYIPQIKLSKIDSGSVAIITNFKNNYLKMEQSNLVFSKSPSYDNIKTFFIFNKPIRRTLWFSTKILLASDDTEIFNGYYSVIQEVQSDTAGLINHFYNSSGDGIDYFVNTDIIDTDNVVSIDTARFSNGGFNTKSFPYLNNRFYKCYFHIQQNSYESEFGTITAFNENYQLDIMEVKFINTLISEPFIPPPPTPNPTTFWYYTQVTLLNNTEIFNGYFSVVREYPSDTYGLINTFYDNALSSNAFVNSDFFGADRVFLLDTLRFSSTGTPMASMPYFKSIYTSSGAYIFKQNGASDAIVVLNAEGNVAFNTINVTITSTLVSNPFPRTLWYSSKILSASDNTELFNAYFSVIQQNPTDTTALMNNFYNALGTDYYVNTNVIAADSIVSLDTGRFSNIGFTTKSFPYLNNMFYNCYFRIRQNTDQSVFGTITVLNLFGNYQLNILEVKFTNTLIYEPIIPPPPIPNPTTSWYSTQVTLADNTEAFKGYFSVVREYTSDTYGLVNSFYDNNWLSNSFVNSGFFGADSVFFLDTLMFSSPGTTMTSFPYFKSLYSSSGVYSFQHNENSDAIVVLNAQGTTILNTTNVTITNDQVDILWYSTQILLQSDDTEIFNGYFSVVKANPTDTQGVINHFYDVFGNDLLSTNYVSADRVFLINDNRLSDWGITTKSFPYLNNIYNNNYFRIYQNPDSSGFGQLNTLNLGGFYQLQNTEVKFVHTSISEPSLPVPPIIATPDPTTFWFSTQVKLPDNTEIFNGYFSVVRQYPSDTYGLVTEFYDASGTWGSSLVNDGFVGADRFFFLDTLKFSSTGSTMTSFQYFKNLYSTSAVYSFQQNGVLDTIALIVTQGQLLDTVNVTITNTQVSDPRIPVWYSTNVQLTSDNTEIFNGYFSVSKIFENASQGLVTHFYDASNQGVDIFVNNGYYGSDSLFNIATSEFSYGGTIITSFPYFQNLYSNSAFYSLWTGEPNNYPGKWVSVLDAAGDVINDINRDEYVEVSVIVTNSPISLIVWYSTKILLASDNSEIFNGYFSVVKANPLDTKGLVNHFYDALGTDLFIFTNFGLADTVFSVDALRFSLYGFLTKSFPFLNNIYNNNYFRIKQDPNSVNGQLIVLNLGGNYQLQSTEVKFVHTLISEPVLPVPPIIPPPSPTTFWFSSQVKLADNTEIFNGYFSVVRAYPSDTYGLITSVFYNSFDTNVFVNDGFVGADRVFFLDILKFSSTGTTITYFPYFKNLYSTSAVYSLQQSTSSDAVAVITGEGDLIETVNVIMTVIPYRRTFWYSTKILLESDNSEIFNGYFGVLKANPTDTTGLVTNFYDLSNQGVDILAFNNYYSADRVFLLDILRFSYNGTNITSFPYVKTLYSNATFYNLYQDQNPAGRSWIAPLDVTGENLATGGEDVRVKCTNSQISWYSLEASIQNIGGTTNTNVKYYFSVDISSSSVTGFYSYNNIGVNLIFLDPPRNEPPYWALVDNVFDTTTLLFSDNNGMNFTDTYLQTQPIQYLLIPQSTQFTLNYPIFNFYGFDFGDGYKNYLWAYAGPPGANEVLTNSIDIQLISGPP